MIEIKDDRDYKKISFEDENDRRCLGYRQNEGLKGITFLHYDEKPSPAPPDPETYSTP